MNGRGHNQGFGSGVFAWIRIRFSNFSGSGSGFQIPLDPDPVCPASFFPDPVCPERLDPDPVCPKRLDPDPVLIRPDPKPWPAIISRDARDE